MNTNTTSMTLGQLFHDADLSLPISIDPQLTVTGVTDNSRAVLPGMVFVATCGTQVDSHRFIPDAVSRGAAVIVALHDRCESATVPVIGLPDTHEALGRLAHAWHGNPSRNMTVVGITGTNGKTTTTFLVETILEAGGYKPGIIGTIEYRYAGKHVKAENTTPGAVALAQLFADMRDAGVDAVAMEVSSHAIDQKRIAGLCFDTALFTNLTQDHLDYHGTMQAYADTKKRLFTEILPLGRKYGKHGGMVLNVDDPTGKQWAEEFGPDVVTFGQNNTAARLQPLNTTTTMHGMQFDINGENIHVDTRLVGGFNISNILGATGIGLALDIPAQRIESGIARLEQVPGRFESVSADLPFAVLVDYSHTPDALERALENLRRVTTGRVRVVFGCGGDRDRTKRPIMGRIAATLADDVIVTDDNPRTEDRQSIADMVMPGVLEVRPDAHDVTMILDRGAAIARAIADAQPGDAVLIAGKGHENYQIIGTTVHDFDDRLVAIACLKDKII